MKAPLLEIELRDHLGKVCLTKENDSDKSHVKVFQEKVEQEIGGMLCVEHIQLPECRRAYSHHRWVIKVRCCCWQQCDAVEARLYQYFG